jgi:hypothetical protein
MHIPASFITSRRSFMLKMFAGCVALFTAVSSLPAHAVGNGAQSGPHYNLNLVGKNDCSPSALTGSNRHTIQVLLNYSDGNGGVLATDLVRSNKIFLSEGEFKVLDGNACDGDGAAFQLPANPFTCSATDPECLNSDPTFQNYSVFVRALAKPGGKGLMTTCAAGAGADGVLNTADDEIVCSTESVMLVRDKGKSSFTNKTKELTTMCLDTDGDSRCDDRVALFDKSLYGYFWDFDNNGLRLVQLRFYPVAD